MNNVLLYSDVEFKFSMTGLILNSFEDLLRACGVVCNLITHRLI